MAPTEFPPSDLDTECEFTEASEAETTDIEKKASKDGIAGSSSPQKTKTKKKKRGNGKRCGACKKRLTMVNEYECRCGGWFCGVHRYAETHDCGFDYKKEGRKMIAEANPVIVAAKIQKI